MTISFALPIAAVIVTGGASLAIGARLKGIADQLPPTDDPIEHTSVYFLGRAGGDPRGRQLVRWFWGAQAGLFLALVALFANWPR